ncbi:hypothetical protein JOE21_001665 [Desmospora profundinema]|uniref:Uncharacterized protein n=1 Tax=Desmospora profundinema TaxID=1571184 RepID=A0ABU1IM82_9BACL|nr:hypothetical protein [Desmospora profundinema]MDR6225667.1 hypothetical protein [Desmospora profundinema]
MRHLWEAKIEEIYVDGSFVTNKPEPGDIDGYYVADAREIASGSIYDRLNQIAKSDVWDIRKREPDEEGIIKPLMWHKHRVELYPHTDDPPQFPESTFSHNFFVKRELELEKVL